MTKSRMLAGLSALVVIGFAAAACSSSSSSSTSSSTSTAAPTTTVVSGDKTAFCADDVTLNKAFSAASTPDAIVAAVKANQATIDDFSKKAPADIKADAQVLVAAAQAAASGDASKFSSPEVQASGPKVDTYCGIQSDGTPIPANAGAGKGTAFCADQQAIDTALQSSTDAASAITAIKSVQSNVDDFAKNIPAAVQADAQTLVAAAQSAVASNDGAKLNTPEVQAAATHVDTYCGIVAPTSSPTTAA